MAPPVIAAQGKTDEKEYEPAERLRYTQVSETGNATNEDGVRNMRPEKLTTITVVSAAVFAALLSTGCPCPRCNDTLVQMTPFSGRFGYYLEGPYNFVGSLTKENLTDQNWRLEGEFAFPTSGYTVGEPDVRIMESFPEQVFVTIEVTPPPPRLCVIQVITNVTVTAAIPASNQAQFTIHITTAS